MVVDDQAVVRAGFAAIVDAEPDLHVVAEAQDGAQAVRLARELSPDVVLMDIRMPGMDGLTATRLLTAEPTEPARPAPRVLVLTTFDQDAYVHDALRAPGPPASSSRTRCRRNSSPASGWWPRARPCSHPPSRAA